MIQEVFHFFLERTERGSHSRPTPWICIFAPSSKTFRILDTKTAEDRWRKVDLREEAR